MAPVRVKTLVTGEAAVMVPQLKLWVPVEYCRALELPVQAGRAMPVRRLDAVLVGLPRALSALMVGSPPPPPPPDTTAQPKPPPGTHWSAWFGLLHTGIGSALGTLMLP